MRLQLQQSQVRELAVRLGAAMTVADLVGRARVVEEAAGDGVQVALDPTPAFAELTAKILPFTKLEPTAALEIFRQKYAVTREAFDTMSARYRSAAFTVAKIESVALIEQVQVEVDRAIAQGLTLEEFRANADQVLASAGVTLDPFHLETVFRTNVISAYAAGRLSQQLRTKRALPYWEYRTVRDSRVRDEHAALHGFIARWDDPVWKAIYPPNGFNCRCGVRAHTRSQALEVAARPRPVVNAQGQKVPGLTTTQDLDIPGLQRLPAGVKIEFDRWPAIDPGAAAVNAKAAAPERSAQAVTERALAIKRAADKRIEPLQHQLDDLEPAIRRGLAQTGKAQAVREAAPLRERVKAEKEAARERILAVARVRRPLDLKPRIGSRVRADRRRVWEAGAREFGRLTVDGSLALADLEVVFRSARRKRSYVAGGVIHMAGLGRGVKTVVHELGHLLEGRNLAVRRKARAFLKRRAGQERPQSLRALTGLRYGRNELTFKDEFLDPYMGKVYPDGETELVSMGVEWLYDRPLELLDDPEYFDWIVGVLRGE